MECFKVDGEEKQQRAWERQKCATNFSNNRKLTNCFIKENTHEIKWKWTEEIENEGKIKVLGYLVGTEIAKNGMHIAMLDDEWTNRRPTII